MFAHLPCEAVVSTSQWCPTLITVASIVSQLICWICDICDSTLAAVASSSLDMAATLSWPWNHFEKKLKKVESKS